MTPRIHVNARDHDTARHMPTYLEEDIMPMEPSYRRTARSFSTALSTGALVAGVTLLIVVIWRGALSQVLS